MFWPTKLETLEKAVVDTKAAYAAWGATNAAWGATNAAWDAADWDAADWDAADWDAAYDAWDDKRAALVNARLELNEYLEVQDYE